MRSRGRHLALGAVIALAGACGDNHGVPADAPIGGSTDAAVDAMGDGTPDATPAAIVGPVQTLDEVEAGPALGTVLIDAAWNGTDFVVSSGSMLHYIGLDGTRHAVVPFASGLWGWLGCATNGTCLVVWSLPNSTALVAQRFDATGTALDPAPFPLALPAGVPVRIGATSGGFIVADTSLTMPFGVVRVPFTGAPLDAVPIEPIPDLIPGAVSRVVQDMDCGTDSCRFVAQTCVEAGCAPLRLVRVNYDGTVVPPVDLPAEDVVSAFACIGSTCLLATQADGPAMPIEGQFVDVDGNPMGARFTIGTFFDPGANFRLAADGTQFRLIVSDQTASPDVRMLSVGIHLDGTLGPVLDLLPSSISTDCVRLTCAPARCLAVSALWNPEGGSGAALYRTRIDGETVLDTAPFLIPAANAQFSPVIGSDGTNVMVSWLDMRAAGDAPTTSLRATPWSPTSGWATASTTDVTNWDAQLRDFTNPGIRAVAWDGARYITAWKENDARHIDVAWFALDGSPPQQVTFDVPAWDVRSVSGIACVTSACFIGTYASDNQLRLLRVDGGTGAITVRSGVALGRNEVRAFSGEIIATGERFDQVVLARFTTDGALISDTVIDDSYPINHSYPAEPALRTTVVGNHLLVVWQSGTQLVGRTISSTFETSSPVVLRTDPSFVSSWAFTTVGDTALLVSHHYAEPLIYGQRLTEDLTLVDAVPFVIAETSSSLVDRLAASLVSADSAIVVWSGMSLDPAILNERLRLVTVTAPD